MTAKGIIIILKALAFFGILFIIGEMVGLL